MISRGLKTVQLTLVPFGQAYLDTCRQCGLHYRVSQDIAHLVHEPIAADEVDKQLEAGTRGDVGDGFLTMTWIVGWNWKFQ